MAKYLVCALFALCVASRPAAAQKFPVAATTPRPNGAVATPSAIEPPAPEPPEVITRNAARQATVRAIRLDTPLRVDGRLDDEVYRTVPAIGDFIQTEPQDGAESTERTEAWIMFDATTIYFSARCWDSSPPSEWVANELRRDTNQLRQNDLFTVVIDTFHDRRNGYLFSSNPLGALSDEALTDEGNPNSDWNPVWDVKTGRFEGGWTIEMAIPFKSIRYNSGKDQVWGVQLRRVIRHKNEFNYLTPLPRSMGGQVGVFRISRAATLVGLDLPAASTNLELKPYGISRVSTDRAAAPPRSNDLTGDVGIDVKYGVTANLTADVTYNTDFAQVEIDEQQVNLTRFSVLFPEKRDFFLEGRGVFEFGRANTFGPGNIGPYGGAAGSSSSGGGPGSGGGGGGGNTPQLFYSRRIGLNANRVIPIDAGGRLTGKVGKFGVGFMDIRTGAETLSATPVTNFTVLRIKRDILRRSSVGAMVTNRSQSVTGKGSNQAYGVDASFSFFQNLSVAGYYSGTRTVGKPRDDKSYLTRLDYSGDRYGARVEHTLVGANFNPEVGYVRRYDISRTSGGLRFSPRPKSSKRVRKYSFEGYLDYLENGAGRLETRQQSTRFVTEFESGDRLMAEAVKNYERLAAPFVIAGVTIREGGYHYNDARISYQLGGQRRVSGNVALESGQYYGGTITGVGYTNARISASAHLSLEPSISINKVEMPVGNFTNTLLRERTDYAFTPRTFISTLIQYSSADHSLSSNVRFRWEYRPGSELFVVYTDGRDTRASGFPPLMNRAFIVKVNRLLRF